MMNKKIQRIKKIKVSKTETVASTDLVQKPKTQNKQEILLKEKDTLNRYWSILGGFNDYPPGWKKITPSEFSHRLIGMSWEAREERRQMIKTGKLPVSAVLFIHHDFTGIATCQIWSKKLNKYVFKFYEFGCQHKYETYRDGDRKRCKKCGTIKLN